MMQFLVVAPETKLPYSPLSPLLCRSSFPCSSMIGVIEDYLDGRIKQLSLLPAEIPPSP
jgi:hypothetical protein